MGTWMVIFAVSVYLDDGGVREKFCQGGVKNRGCA